MNRDAVWYITMTIVVIAVFSAAAIVMRGEQQVRTVCAQAHGEMRDGACTFRGER
jgi:hypothetical protein